MVILEMPIFIDARSDLRILFLYLLFSFLYIFATEKMELSLSTGLIILIVILLVVLFVQSKEKLDGGNSGGTTSKQTWSAAQLIPNFVMGSNKSSNNSGNNSSGINVNPLTSYNATYNRPTSGMFS